MPHEIREPSVYGVYGDRDSFLRMCVLSLVYILIYTFFEYTQEGKKTIDILL